MNHRPDRRASRHGSDPTDGTVGDESPAGSTGDGDAGSGMDEAADSDGAADGTLTVATATTVHDSGLVAELARGFERDVGPSVKAVVRGTASALRTASDGDADVVLVHARPLEDEFLAAGHGINRRRVMGNDFLLVGPPGDPAAASGLDPVAALRAVAETEATFLSRGDRSGTHVRERELWAKAGIDPSGEWYRETGRGMGDTLVVAREASAYTLTDRGTYLTVADGELVAHVDRGIDDPGPLLRNEYAVIPTNPARHDVAYQLAMAFVGYLTGPGQALIEAFRVDGRPAFRPLAHSGGADFGQYVPSDWRG